MYTRNRPSQSYTRNSNNSQGQGSYASNFNTQGSYQASQSAPIQQSNYKQGNVPQNLQGFKSQQQQQQPPAQMAAGSPRLLPNIASTQQMKPSMSQQQLQQGQQGQMPQQPPPPPPPSLQQQQAQQQQSQQQMSSSAAPLPQRLKPILKQSTVNVQSAPTSVAQAAPVPSQPCVPSPVPAPTSTNNNSDSKDDSMQSENTDMDLLEAQPRWRRKNPGFKVNKKLKRLRMNQRLRKTLQPKNAIMVLNEMKAGVQFTFPETQGPMPNSLYLVHAELDGKTFVGQGLSKPLARQNAAENALKALLLEKMTTASMKARIDAESEVQANSSMDSSMDVKEENNDSNATDANTQEDEIPWSSLASFALYKLFLEWHNQGTSIPISRPGLPSTKTPKKENSTPKDPFQKDLPPNPTNIHPVMLLNQMRPGLTYVELNRVGNPPNTMFTLAVEVDGVEYSGTARNKKDAKKSAAKAALSALYNLTYPEDSAQQDNMVID